MPQVNVPLACSAGVTGSSLRHSKLSIRLTAAGRLRFCHFVGLIHRFKRPESHEVITPCTVKGAAGREKLRSPNAALPVSYFIFADQRDGNSQINDCGHLPNRLNLVYNAEKIIRDR
jgi:hypothetical protein